MQQECNKNKASWQGKCPNKEKELQNQNIKRIRERIKILTKDS